MDGNQEQEVKKDETQRENGDSLVKEITWRHYSFFVLHFIQSIFYATSFPPMRQYLYTKIANEHIKNTSFAINSTFDIGGNSLCWSHNASTERDATQQKIQAETATWTRYMTLTSGVLQVITWFYLSYLADFVGRKPMIIINNLGYILRLSVYAAVIYFDLAKGYLLIGLVFDGLSGGYSGYNQLTSIYTADVTKRGKMRGFFLTVIYSLTDIFYGSVNLLSGYMLKSYKFFWPISLSLIVHVILNITLYFIVPETLEQKGELKDLSPTKSVRSVVSFYLHKTEKDGGRTRFKFWLCLISYTLIMLAIIGKWDVTPLFAMNSPFCWTSVELGHFNGSLTIIQPAITIIILYILQRFLSHELIAVFGLLSMAIENLTLAFSTQSWMLYLSAVVGSSGPLTISMIRTIISHLTDPKEQGAAFAGLGTMEGLSGMTSSALLTTIYASTLSWMKGFVFVISSLFFILPVILMSIVHHVNKKEKAKETCELTFKKNANENSAKENQQIECLGIKNKAFIPEENTG